MEPQDICVCSGCGRYMCVLHCVVRAVCVEFTYICVGCMCVEGTGLCVEPVCMHMCVGSV